MFSQLAQIFRRAESQRAGFKPTPTNPNSFLRFLRALRFNNPILKSFLVAAVPRYVLCGQLFRIFFPGRSQPPPYDLCALCGEFFSSLKSPIGFDPTGLLLLIVEVVSTESPADRFTIEN